MSYNRQTRRAVSNRKSTQKSGWNNRRRRKSKSSTSIFPALIIEGLAVAFILYLFLNMRADLNRQARLKMMGDSNETRLFDAHETEMDSLEFVFDQATDFQWDHCWNQFGSAN